ncbi:hypothetical protein [Kitasatospora terrestris]|uniref:Uncharacterized protein n=1 Tax=Kitasatospora terrestris TaxID=258051 RepID=A0ABP9EIC5_9ACTN
MPTYAVVTAAPADRVLTALQSSKLGGYLYPGTDRAGGTALLFDPPRPRFGRISRGRLIDPAWRLAVELKTATWLLEAGDGGAGATACYAGGSYDSIGWAEDWTPPEDPAAREADLRGWHECCAKVAAKAGLPDVHALGAIRNDPAPDGTRTSSEELLRSLCALVGAPDTVVGQSLFCQAGPAGRDFTRFEAKGR